MAEECETLSISGYQNETQNGCQIHFKSIQIGLSLIAIDDAFT